MTHRRGRGPARRGARRRPAAPAATPALAAAPIMRSEASWLCLPGRDDACRRPLPTTALNPNGYGSTGQVEPAANPPIDCFYVYPTVSRDPGVNSRSRRRARGAGRRRGPVRPLRHGLPDLRADLPAGDADRAPQGDGRRAPIERQFRARLMRDVAAAWHYYLAHYNKGRPFVLIGHSQGSIHARAAARRARSRTARQRRGCSRR